MPREVKKGRLRPHMSLSNKTGVVASPVATSPSRTLVQELDIIFQGRLDLALHVVLNPSLPSIGNQPTCDKVVIVSIELELTPTFSLETIQKQWALQDLGSECTSTTRHAGGSTIKSMCCRDLKVASLNIGCAEPVVQHIANWTVSDSLDPLTRTNSSHSTIFEGREKPGQDGSWPRDIVVCHDDDRSFDLGDSLTDLNALVGNGNLESSDVGCFERLDKADELGVLVGCGNQQEFVGLACQNTLEGFS